MRATSISQFIYKYYLRNISDVLKETENKF